jgi:branched-chain amino acid transport system ATP-binding protein
MTISGIQPLSDGRLLLDGSDISLLPADERVTRGVVQVPEGRRIFPRLSVLDNLLLGAYRSTDKTVSTKTQQLIFDLFPILFERKKQLGGTLSGGEQQMLAIGRALMANPRLLLLDEPSMGIAPLLVNKIFAALKELHSQGLTIFLVEQNAHAALTLSQRAYVLETGSVTLSDSSSSLLTDPRIKDAYLGA